MPLNPRQRHPVLVVQESGWAPWSVWVGPMVGLGGPHGRSGWAPWSVWLGAEILAPTGIRSPDFPARSQSPYRLRYPGPCKPLIPSLIQIHLVIWDNTQYKMVWETAVAQWLRCCSTNRKVAGSIPASVSGFFIDIKSFRSHYGPGVESASNRNEYQEYFLRVRAAGA